MEQILRLSESKQVVWSYDPEVDVLLIHMGEPKPAVTYDAGNGLLIRYDEKTGELLGFEILQASKKMKR